MFKLNNNQVVFSKVTAEPIKVLAVVKQNTVSRENLIAVCDTRMDSLGRIYAIPETTRLIKQGSIERRYEV